MQSTPSWGGAGHSLVVHLPAVPPSLLLVLVRCRRRRRPCQWHWPLVIQPWCTHHPPNEQLLVSVGLGAPSSIVPVLPLSIVPVLPSSIVPVLPLSFASPLSPLSLSSFAPRRPRRRCRPFLPVPVPIPIIVVVVVDGGLFLALANVVVGRRGGGCWVIRRRWRVLWPFFAGGAGVVVVVVSLPFVSPPLRCRRRSTRDTPPEQLLVGLGAGGVSFVAVGGCGGALVLDSVVGICFGRVWAGQHDAACLRG
jgi:hypothetical protein